MLTGGEALSAVRARPPAAERHALLDACGWQPRAEPTVTLITDAKLIQLPLSLLRREWRWTRRRRRRRLLHALSLRRLVVEMSIAAGVIPVASVTPAVGPVAVSAAIRGISAISTAIVATATAGQSSQGSEQQDPRPHTV